MKLTNLYNLQSFFTGFTSSWMTVDTKYNAPLIVEDAACQTSFDFNDLHRLHDRCVKFYPAKADDYFSEVISLAINQGISLDHAFVIRKEQQLS
jgi:hypothetical protein